MAYVRINGRVIILGGKCITWGQGELQIRENCFLAMVIRKIDGTMILEVGYT